MKIREPNGLSGGLTNSTRVISLLALTGVLLVLLPPAHAASGDSGTSTYETLAHGAVAQPVTGGTTSGSGLDGAAQAEASERAAGGIAVPADPELVYPKSVQHQSSAQNPLCAEGRSLAPNPNHGGAPSDNSPSSEAIGKCLHVAAEPPVSPPPAAEAARPAPLRGTKIVTLRGPHFDFDRSIVKPAGRVLLDEAIVVMNENPELRVVAEGHTDWMGSDGYNQKLGDRRDRTVRDYMVSHGIDSNRIDTRSFGESNPVATNDTDAGRALNRRVELIVL